MKTYMKWNFFSYNRIDWIAAMDFSSRRYWEIEKCTYYIRRTAGDTRKLDTTYASSRSRQTLPRGKPRILNIRSRVPGVFIRAAVNPRAAQETKSCARKIVHDCARQSLLSSLNVIENRCTKSTLVFRHPPSSIDSNLFYRVSLCFYDRTILLSFIDSVLRTSM